MIPMGKCIYSTGTFSSLCILARAEQNIDKRQRKMKQNREMGARENNKSQSVWGAQHMPDDILKSPHMLTHLNFSKPVTQFLLHLLIYKKETDSETVSGFPKVRQLSSRGKLGFSLRQRVRTTIELNSFSQETGKGTRVRCDERIGKKRGGKYESDAEIEIGKSVQARKASRWEGSGSLGARCDWEPGSTSSGEAPGLGADPGGVGEFSSFLCCSFQNMVLQGLQFDSRNNCGPKLA